MMAARGLTARDLLARLGRERDRATMYRLLAGQTENPRLDTLLAVCTALDTTPNELLDQAEILPQRPRSADLLDLRLRVAFRRLQSLPARSKALAIAQVLLLLETWERDAAGLPIEDLLDTVVEHAAGGASARPTTACGD